VSNPHLVDGDFQSDKYPTTPRGKVPLSTKDPIAQDLLWQYAQRRREVDAAFSDALEAALKARGFTPPDTPLAERPSFEQVNGSPLTKALKALRAEFGLIGVVLIDFTKERVGVCTAGSTEEFAQHMVTLGDRILTAIDNGQFDPVPDGD
jgi:hypothetical protein